MATDKLTQEELKLWIDYNPETGVFERKKYASKKRPCGNLDKDGYLRISIKHKIYRAHHLAWLWVHGNFPNGVIDHINQIRNDNRISNLRETTQSINALNSDKKLGVYKHHNKFRARVKIGNKQIHLGLFNSQEEARNAYLFAKEKHIGLIHGY